MTPKLENKAFSVKSTQYMPLERCKEPYKTALWTRKRGTLYVAVSVVTDTQMHRHTHGTTTVTLTHTPRVNYWLTGYKYAGVCLAVQNTIVNSAYKYIILLN